MEGAHLLVGTLGYYCNPELDTGGEGMTIRELLFSVLVLKIDLFKCGFPADPDVLDQDEVSKQAYI